MEYPKIFEACPVCKNKVRIVESERNAQVEAGVMNPKATIPALFTQSFMFDPNDKSIILARRQVPMLLASYDICSECGTLYCTRVEKKMIMMEPGIKAKGQG